MGSGFGLWAVAQSKMRQIGKPSGAMVGEYVFLASEYLFEAFPLPTLFQFIIGCFNAMGASSLISVSIITQLVMD